MILFRSVHHQAYLWLLSIFNVVYAGNKQRDLVWVVDLSSEPEGKLEPGQETCARGASESAYVIRRENRQIFRHGKKERLYSITVV